MAGVSGQFGIRLHRGPHYPRSKRTRESCQESYQRFCTTYPELVVPHEESIYAYGEVDADGCPSKVSSQQFADVCREFGETRSIDLGVRDFKGVDFAYSLEEPSVAVGAWLRSFFEQRLADKQVPVLTYADVKSIDTCRAGGSITKVIRFTSTRIQRWLYAACASPLALSCCEVDFVVNATGYQSLIPPKLYRQPPAELETFYQVCLALRYVDTRSGSKPMSFIVMDGWFPCLMPLIESAEEAPTSRPSRGFSRDPESVERDSLNQPRQQEYILTHGSHTILGSFYSPEAAQNFYDNQLSDAYVSTHVRTPTESEVTRFWPSFLQRFTYNGWKGAVLAKPCTQTELRSSLVFEKDSIVYVFPGKISNIFSACDEVMQLFESRHSRDHDNIVFDEDSGCSFTKNGSLHCSQEELKTKPGGGSRSTCELGPHVP